MNVQRQRYNIAKSLQPQHCTARPGQDSSLLQHIRAQELFDSSFRTPPFSLASREANKSCAMACICALLQQTVKK